MSRIKLTLEYDGARYVGWQTQPNGPTIQSELERGLRALTGAHVSVSGAGRTDAGVHARGQVAAFDAPKPLPLKAFHLGLNAHLPPDIAVVRAEEVPADFDPRRWARGKRYIYAVSNQRTRSPLRRSTHFEVFAPLDAGAMREAAKCLLGRHDFAAFRASDCEAKSSIREIFRADVLDGPHQEFRFVFEGTAFLKYMVRTLVGSLLEVGRKRKPVEWLGQVLVGLDRSKAGPTAPARGLVLDEVFYADGAAKVDHG